MNNGHDAKSNQDVTAGKELLNGHQAIRQFAASLTERTRELDQKERDYLIDPKQSTQILQGMIENFVYTVVKLELRRLSDD